MQTGWRAPPTRTASVSLSARSWRLLDSLLVVGMWLVEVKSKFKTKTVKNKENPVQTSV